MSNLNLILFLIVIVFLIIIFPIMLDSNLYKKINQFFKDKLFYSFKFYVLSFLFVFLLKVNGFFKQDIKLVDCYYRNNKIVCDETCTIKKNIDNYHSYFIIKCINKSYFENFIASVLIIILSGLPFALLMPGNKNKS